MGPVSAPLVDVAVHVVQAPRVGRVAADLRGAIERRAWFGTIIRLALEVSLFTAERIAKRSGRRGSGPAGIFPLRFGGRPELPILREVTGLVAEFGQFPAIRLHLRKVDVAHRVVIPFEQL